MPVPGGELQRVTLEIEEGIECLDEGCGRRQTEDALFRRPEKLQTLPPGCNG